VAENYKNRALDHARKGYFVFPAQLDKRPLKGLLQWESVATRDEAQINAWWDADPTLLPAIPPGRSGCAVIDVDRHEGKEDGFASLEKSGVDLPSTFKGTSLSGNGNHFWFRGDVGSVNGIFPGVDRKARGGYVVVPYELPDISEITTALPEVLSGGIKASSVERKYMTNSELNSWLRTVGAGEPGEEMYLLLEKFKPHGNQQMSILVAKVVSLASQGYPGAGVILDQMQDIWLSVAHSSGDPEEEFQVNIRSAIEKFGEPVPDTSAEDKMKELSAWRPKPDPDKMLDAVLYPYETSYPDWVVRRTDPKISSAILFLHEDAKKVRTEDVELWVFAARAHLKKVVENG
jgi:hypothetical protein